VPSVQQDPQAQRRALPAPRTLRSLSRCGDPSAL
jgi:hypothetical protein